MGRCHGHIKSVISIYIQFGEGNMIFIIVIVKMHWIEEIWLSMVGRGRWLLKIDSFFCLMMFSVGFEVFLVWYLANICHVT